MSYMKSYTIWYIYYCYRQGLNSVTSTVVIKLFILFRVTVQFQGCFTIDEIVLPGVNIKSDSRNVIILQSNADYTNHLYLVTRQPLVVLHAC